jgi:preprotein translocase subunit Sss1
MTITQLQALEVIVEDTDLLETVSQNIQFHTPRQIKMTEQVRRIYEMSRRPSFDDFKIIIKSDSLFHDSTN